MNDSRIDWFSILQFTLSTLAVLVLLGGAALLVGVTAVGALRVPLSVDALPLLTLAVTAAASGLLVLPSAVYALLRLMERPALSIGRWAAFLRPTPFLLLLPVVLWLGNWAAHDNHLGWLLLPLLQILAVGLPVWWLVSRGIRRLPIGSPQRTWGVVGSGLVLGPSLSLMAEAALLVAGILVLAVVLASRVDLRDQLLALARHLRLASPEAVPDLVAPYLFNPGVLFSALLFMSVLVPLTEEALKPVGVWLLVGQKLTPAAGFAAGVLSGAGFALFESLTQSGAGEDWSFLMVARIGAAALHIANTGLMGWALARAWSEGRYLRLGITYLTVVFIHGLWNGLAVLSILPELDASLAASQMGWVLQLGQVAPYALVVLALAAFAILVGGNRMLSRGEAEMKALAPVA